MNYISATKQVSSFTELFGYGDTNDSELSIGDNTWLGTG
jgi:hypothetical protein